MRTILIDGDMVGWRIAYQPDRITDRTVNCIERWQKSLEADRVIIAFSDASGKYFRHQLLAGYKPDRTAKPAGFQEAIDAMETAFVAKRLPGLEADDVLGILATHPSVKGERIVVAHDKDMLTIPGQHFDPYKEPRQGIITISERDGDYNHLWQALTGDSSDGYSGCPGIGPAKARRVIWGDDKRQWWNQVVCAFKGAGRTEADALLQARLARILRADDYDLITKQVRLWDPHK